MKSSDRYIKLVYWSDEDQLYIGRSPGLFWGGVHGKDERKVFQALVKEIDAWIEIIEQDGRPLPPATAGKKYSGRFNLRTGEELHELLAIEAMKVSESLNTYCVKVLRDKVQKT